MCTIWAARLVRNWWAKVAAHMLVFSFKFCWVSVPTVLCLGAHWRLFCVTFFRSCTTNLLIALSLQFFYCWSSSVGIKCPLSSGMCKILPSGASSWVKSTANWPQYTLEKIPNHTNHLHGSLLIRFECPELVEFGGVPDHSWPPGLVWN